MAEFVRLLRDNRAALRKFFVAVFAAVAMTGVVWTTGDPASTITGPEWLQVVLAFGTAIGVYGVPNGTP